jgi:protein-S-isoprenylcysteine O-methyltransferase Ste14
MSLLQEQYERWSKREYSARRRVVALVPLGILFLVALPLLLVVASAFLDRRLRLPRCSHGSVHGLIGVVLAVTGLAFGLWSIRAQFELGRGTPVPVMPTQTLVVQPPYTYCRNPMTLGTFSAYLGVAVGIGSLSAVGLVLLFLALLVAYNKLIEEKELPVRFGAEYLAYKRTTPFLIPHFSLHSILWHRNTVMR